jgi:putative ABC transport system ATP-binding protein
MTDVTIVEARGVHKIYDTGTVQVHALRGVDVAIKRGEMVAIVGPSGCGKTTLLNCLSGLDSVTEGGVLIEGTDLETLTDNQKTDYRAEHIGFIFQFYNLLPVLTAVENVELPLLLARKKPDEARERALAMLEVVELRKWANHKPAQLSGGQRQRVTIARALVNGPFIVFGDEPTGDLDRETSDSIMDLICRLNKENDQTFVIVTHDQKVAHRADRVLVMNDGNIVKEYVPTTW